MQNIRLAGINQIMRRLSGVFWTVSQWLWVWQKWSSNETVYESPEQLQVTPICNIFRAATRVTSHHQFTTRQINRAATLMYRPKVTGLLKTRVWPSILGFQFSTLPKNLSPISELSTYPQQNWFCFSFSPLGSVYVARSILPFSYSCNGEILM